MIPESQADKLLAPIYTTYTDVETTILAHAGDIQLTLLCAKSNLDAAQQRVDELAEPPGRSARRLALLLRQVAESLEQIVLYYLGLRQATLAVAESCTGGMIAQRITSRPRQFALLPRRRRRLLRRAQDRLRRRPSRTHRPARRSLAGMAEALATGIRLRTGATLGLGVTGIAGPTGATETKPVGLVYIALSDAQKTERTERTFRGDRDRVRSGPPSKPST